MRQHVIPRCYLKAWCDPVVSPGQHPFVWRISRDGKTRRKRSPEKSFTSADRYTITLPNREKELVLEKTLSGIEDAFVKTLSRVRERANLNAVDRANLCTFAAAMFSRTIQFGENLREFWESVHEKVVRLEKQHQAEPTTSLETGRYVEFASQLALATSLRVLPPLLFEMSMTVVSTDNAVGFITSDSPCVWWNPKAHTFPPFYRAPGLEQKDIEVTLPLTPQHTLVLTHHDLPAYTRVGQKSVDELNRRTRFFCENEFVSWKGEIRDYWLDPGAQPDDAWENTEEAKRLIARDRALKEAHEAWIGRREAHATEPVERVSNAPREWTPE